MKDIIKTIITESEEKRKLAELTRKYSIEDHVECENQVSKNEEACPTIEKFVKLFTEIIAINFYLETKARLCLDIAANNQEKIEHIDECNDAQFAYALYMDDWIDRSMTLLNLHQNMSALLGKDDTYSL